MKSAIIGCVLGVGVYLACRQSANQPSLSCNTLAAYTAEKMYTCGMLRSYEGVSRVRDDMSINLARRQASDTECANVLDLESKQTCPEFEAMVNNLAVR